MTHYNDGTGVGVNGTVFAASMSPLAVSLGGWFQAYPSITGTSATLLGAEAVASDPTGLSTGAIDGFITYATGSNTTGPVQGALIDAIGQNAASVVGLHSVASGSTTANVGIIAQASGTASTAIMVLSSNVALEIQSGSVRATASAGSRFADTKTLTGGATTENIASSVCNTGSTIVITFEGTAARMAALGSLLITTRNNGSFVVGNANNINFQNTDVVHYIIINH
jgi:hypothetical protein